MNNTIQKTILSIVKKIVKNFKQSRDKNKNKGNFH